VGILKSTQSRDIKKNFVSFINKIFALNNSWLKDDVELITLQGDNSPSAYEQYPWDNENYPIVVLSSEGATDDAWAIDSKISNYTETMKLGVTARTYETLSANPIAAAITPRRGNLSLRAVDLLVKNIGPYEEPIFVRLLSTTGGVPDTILASGSIAGKQTSGIKWLQTALYPRVVLQQDTTYALSAQAFSGSYYWFVDNIINTDSTPTPTKWAYNGVTWDTISDESPIAKVYGPTVRRLGGGLNTTLRIFIETKDLSTTQKIADLLFVYLHLARHSNVMRSEQLDSPNVTNTNYDFVSNLSDEGIYILKVNKGAETVRDRGNDRLFSIDLALSCYSNWTEDFTLPVLEDIDIDPDPGGITSF